MDSWQGDDVDALARGYVSGSLSPATMEGVERRLRTDEALRQAVVRCEKRKASAASPPNDERPPSERRFRQDSAAVRLWNDARFWRWVSALAVAAAVALAAALVVVAR